MISLTKPSFWNAYERLPLNIQQAARRSYRLFRDNPAHPSLRFKK